LAETIERKAVKYPPIPSC